MTVAASTPSSVLVVDDAEGSRFVFANWLRRAGHEVFEAATGAEAIELLARLRIDLVLLDVHLPDMSGFDVCDHIKAGRATAAIPVLHVSATATGPDDRSAGLNRGADGYLIEPVQRDELLATVTALLRYHEARRTSDRAAARLEQLHQTTLLIHAAPSISDLLELAAIGVTATLGAASAVLIIHNGRAQLAKASPNEISPTVTTIDIATALAIAAAAGSDRSEDLDALRGAIGVAEGQASRGTTITTPRGEMVGAVVLHSDLGGTQDGLILDHLSQTLAVAVENLRLYDVEHQIAVTLQHAMLPERLPKPEGLEIEVRYLAASDTVEIGGDFYEAISVPGGMTLLAVGDVVGHSLRAATIMAELRYSLRAFVSMGLTASEVLSQLNSLLMESHPGAIATICLVEIDPSRQQILVTNAGHLPPLVSDGHDAYFIADHGPLLGLDSKRDIPTVAVPFPNNAIVLLTTDGLVERRHEDVALGLERLRLEVLAHTGSLRDLCDGLLQTFTSDTEIFDDIAMLAARRTSSIAP